MTDRAATPDDITDRLLSAIEPHVVFDGWSETAFRQAVGDADVDPTVARGVCPRGAVDLALAFHRRGDDEMVRRLNGMDLAGMRLRDKIALAVRTRLELVPDKELVRRGGTLFALPMYAADGARAVWETADRIWVALGDRSDDVNWYTKRASLAGVYSATVLYWLGDESEGNARSWAFLDRRIDGVMQIEKLKAQVNENALLRPFAQTAEWALSWVKPPARGPNADLPGRWTGGDT